MIDVQANQQALMRTHSDASQTPLIITFAAIHPSAKSSAYSSSDGIAGSQAEYQSQLPVTEAVASLATLDWFPVERVQQFFERSRPSKPDRSYKLQKSLVSDP
jgi:hypothetical protein